MKHSIRNQITSAFATLILACILLTACDNNDTAFTKQVFIAGQDSDTVSSFTDMPIVWINNKAETLERDNLNNYTKAIDAEGSDYYTTGYANAANRWVGKVWKNNKLLYELSDGYSVGWGIDVVNTDVYVAGHYYNKEQLKHFAFVNKNGNMTMLTDGTKQAEAFAVKVSGNDIYVGGYDGNQARLWKNGTPLTLNNSDNFRIRAIAIEGTDVYAVGECNCFSNIVIRYWKNGVETTVTDGTFTAYGYDIAVSGSDVYIAGVERSSNKQIAKVWKNGVSTNLTDGTKNAWAYGLILKDNDVYVVGMERSANDIYNTAMLWKNGTAIKLGSRRSIAYDIAQN